MVAVSHFDTSRLLPFDRALVDRKLGIQILLKYLLVARMDITGTFENAGTEGTWFVEEMTVKSAPIAIARALVHP